MSWFAGILAAAVLATAIFPETSAAAPGKAQPGQAQSGPSKPRLWADEVSESIKAPAKGSNGDVGSPGGGASKGSGPKSEQGKGAGPGGHGLRHDDGQGNKR